MIRSCSGVSDNLLFGYVLQKVNLTHHLNALFHLEQLHPQARWKGVSSTFIPRTPTFNDESSHAELKTRWVQKYSCSVSSVRCVANSSISVCKSYLFDIDISGIRHTRKTVVVLVINAQSASLRSLVAAESKAAEIKATVACFESICQLLIGICLECVCQL